MNHPQLTELQRIFDLACELPSNERMALIERECAGDEILMRNVSELLEADVRQNMLDDPLALAELVNQSPPSSGTYIGPYRLLEKIGEGGMGLVFLAQQESPIQRKVAVKVVRNGELNSDAISRYQVEKQALARFDHPCLTKIFDAGVTENDQLFFVMEYVDGQSITDYCDQHKISVEGRLQMFGKVCDAIQHAHENKTIHRDIKPSNILVTKSGDQVLPKVIDFGIAKVLGKEELNDPLHLTRPGFLIGTPTYMSPEQADMNAEFVDARTDIYSLGVVLFELLTGKAPLADTAHHQGLIKTLESKRNSDFESPYELVRRTTINSSGHELFSNRSTNRSQLLRFLKSDITPIVLKAMEGDPNDRYSSTAELRSEIDLFLEGKPVSASVAGVSTRVGKWVNRNRRFATLGAFACVAVVSALVLSIVMASRASKAKLKYAFLERKICNSDEFLYAAMKQVSAAEQLRSRLGRYQRNQAAIKQAKQNFMKSQMPGMDMVGMGMPGVDAMPPPSGMEFILDMMTGQMGIDCIIRQKTFCETEPELPIVDFQFLDCFNPEFMANVGPPGFGDFGPPPFMPAGEMPTDSPPFEVEFGPFGPFEVGMLEGMGPFGFGPLGVGPFSVGHFGMLSLPTKFGSFDDEALEGTPPGFRMFVHQMEDMNEYSSPMEMQLNQTVDFCNCLLKAQNEEFDGQSLYQADTLEVLAQLYMKLERNNDAQKALERSSKIHDALDAEPQQNRMVLHKLLMMKCLRAQGDTESVGELERRARLELADLTSKNAKSELQKLLAEIMEKE